MSFGKINEFMNYYVGKATTAVAENLDVLSSELGKYAKLLDITVNHAKPFEHFSAFSKQYFKRETPIYNASAKTVLPYVKGTADVLELLPSFTKCCEKLETVYNRFTATKKSAAAITSALLESVSEGTGAYGNAYDAACFLADRGVSRFSGVKESFSRASLQALFLGATARVTLAADKVISYFRKTSFLAQKVVESSKEAISSSFVVTENASNMVFSASLLAKADPRIASVSSFVSTMSKLGGFWTSSKSVEMPWAFTVVSGAVTSFMASKLQKAEDKLKSLRTQLEKLEKEKAAAQQLNLPLSQEREEIGAQIAKYEKALSELETAANAAAETKDANYGGLEEAKAKLQEAEEKLQEAKAKPGADVVASAVLERQVQTAREEVNAADEKAKASLAASVAARDVFLAGDEELKVLNSRRKALFALIDHEQQIAKFKIDDKKVAEFDNQINKLNGQIAALEIEIASLKKDDKKPV
jgi:hypothetical protein